MADLKIVDLPRGPSLMDVSAHLRRIADEIEAGDWGDNPTGIFLMPRDGDWPALFGWGPNTSEAEVVFAMQQAVTFLTNTLVGRR